MINLVSLHSEHSHSPDNEVLTHVVLNENSLGYMFKLNGFFYVGVLASSIIRGGRSCLSGSYPLSELDTIRPATLEDFSDYRISSEGYNL